MTRFRRSAAAKPLLIAMLRLALVSYLVSVVSPVYGISTPDAVKEQLKSLYDSMGGDFWNYDALNKAVNSSQYALGTARWSFQPGSDPCSMAAAARFAGLICSKSADNANFLVDTVILQAAATRGGSLPASLNMPDLTTLDLSHNELAGTIPTMNLPKLSILDLSYNQLCGAIPPTALGLSNLRSIRLQHNQLVTPEGARANFLNGLNQSALAILDVSFNRFSGDLGEQVFAKFSKLTALNVGSNCFSGALPENICNAESLEMLIMSEMTGAPQCQRKYWSNTPLHSLFSGFAYQTYLSGQVPTCLFSMRNISGLYMSSLGLSGYLPDAISPRLKFLDLSQNKIMGTIPPAFFSNKLERLDLSYNLLSGNLASANGVQYSPAYNLSLTVNYLSGNIPDSYVFMSGLNVLTGNLFACSDEKPLPVYDKIKDNYVCASSVFDQAAILVMVAFCLIGCCMVLVYSQWHNPTSRFHERLIKLAQEAQIWYEVSLPEKALRNLDPAVSKAGALLRDVQELKGDEAYAGFLRYLRLISRMRMLILYIGSSITFLFGTLYLVLSGPKSRTLTSTYLWVSTAGYLSGALAALICAFLYLITIATVRDMLVFEDVMKRRRLQEKEDEIDQARHSQQRLLRESLTSSDRLSSNPSRSSQELRSQNSQNSPVASYSPPASPTAFEKLPPRSDSPRTPSPDSADSPRSISDHDWSDANRGRKFARRGGMVPEALEVTWTSRVCLDNVLPTLRIIILCAVAISIFIAINITYVAIYLKSSRSAQKIAEVILSVIYATYDSFTDFLFNDSDWFLFGISRARNNRFARRVWGSMMVPVLFTKLVNMTFIPFAVTAAMDPSCFKGVFFASAPQSMEYQSWSCATKTCQGFVQSVITETAQQPFTYNYQCSASLLRAFVPIYIGDFIVKLGFALSKVSYLAVYGVAGAAPEDIQTRNADISLDKIFQGTPFNAPAGESESAVQPDNVKKIINSNKSIEISPPPKGTEGGSHPPLLVDRQPLGEELVEWANVTPPTAPASAPAMALVMPSVPSPSKSDETVVDGIAAGDSSRAASTAAIGLKRKETLLTRTSKLIWRFAFNSAKLLRSFHYRKRKFQRKPDKRVEVAVKSLDNISTYISNLILITCIGTLAPLLAALFTAVTVLDIAADQLVLGRFFVIEASIIVLVSRGHTHMTLSDAEGGGNANPDTIVTQRKTVAVEITQEMLDDVDKPYGSTACLTLAEEECETIDTNTLSSCKTILVTFSSTICAVFINDMYNGNRMTQPTLVAPSIMLLFIPTIEFIILLIKCYNPRYFDDKKKVSFREQAEFKQQEKDKSRTRALRVKAGESPVGILPQNRKRGLSSKISSLFGRSSSSSSSTSSKNVTFGVPATEKSSRLKAIASVRAIKDMDAGINPILSSDYSVPSPDASSPGTASPRPASPGIASEVADLPSTAEATTDSAHSAAPQSGDVKSLRAMKVSEGMRIIQPTKSPQSSVLAAPAAAEVTAPAPAPVPVPVPAEAVSTDVAKDSADQPEKRKLSIVNKIRKSLFGRSYEVNSVAVKPLAEQTAGASSAYTPAPAPAPAHAPARAPAPSAEHHTTINGADKTPAKRSTLKPSGVMHDDVTNIYDAL